MTPILSDDVAAALSAGRPVVALESTIISHGMPWPRNAEVARAVEDAVRDEGAVPATIAVLDGRLRAGLTEADIALLGQDETVVKAASRDLGAAVVHRRHAGTTVSATMRIAALAGIGTFATGGIGGVHRGDGMDVSADLTELAATDVLVVCAGVKSILDIPRTLEVLETLRVPVVTFGADAFPAFYTRDSGCPTPERADDPAAIAAMRAAHRALGLGTGMLVANPIPASHALSAEHMDAEIAAALAEADAQGVRGKDVTPFLLGRLNAVTDGAALDANVALVLDNARLAARIAVAEAGTGSWA
ncbi:pseudouridine-5'-phosphate glycosidase [Jannaschia sp. LMIT008]|uniref:pseudouridine-5'-phosphate glycosidase n=1 Tax=Jannaschia maritima TaxID=3032585 RepID=UPI002810EF2A|nr:pseudouridine-5'-phosphate glycosidase [Jannaschia sp. LMIT008]